MRYFKHVPTAVLVIIIAFLVFQYWKMFQPESSGEFEMTGEFQSADYSGSLMVGGGEEYNTTQYSLILTNEEADRVDTKYTDWSRKSGPGPVDDRPGYMYYGRESTGNWCGELPAIGDTVRISSPSGYTRDVIIEDLTTGVTYRSLVNCERPMLLFHYRITNRATGVVLEEDTISGHDTFEAAHSFRSYMSDDDYIFQIWEDGQTAPPAITPEP